MSTVPINDSPYAGSTSPMPWRLRQPRLECLRCGSSLTGRRRSVRRITTQGVAFVIETFRCPCGRGRRVERQERAM